MSIKLGRPRFGLWEEQSNPIDQSVPTTHDILQNKGRTDIYVAKVRATWRANPSASVNGTIMFTNIGHTTFSNPITTALLQYGLATDSYAVTAEWISPIPGYGFILPPNTVLAINFDTAGVVALVVSDVTFAT